MGSYFLPSLNQRQLRVSLEGPWTEYRWYEEKCKTRILGVCVAHTYTEHIERDFDFTKAEDRKKFLEMGFFCGVRKIPKGGQQDESNEH